MEEVQEGVEKGQDSADQKKKKTKSKSLVVTAAGDDSLSLSEKGDLKDGGGGWRGDAARSTRGCNPSRGFATIFFFFSLRSTSIMFLMIKYLPPPSLIVPRVAES